MLKIIKKDELTNEIAVIVGTRPGIIKFSPVIRALAKRKLPFFIIHTGQHYSYNMDKQFFEDLELPEPRYANDKVKQEVLHGAQTAEMIRGIEAALIEAKPRIVIVGGDANTNLAGALATRKLGIELAHMEAGLRSHDWQMPEEHNRVIIDHISEILFPPTNQTKENLLKDNVYGELHVVGNPIVDAVQQNIELANRKSNIIKRLRLNGKNYFLFTMHREENVDHASVVAKHLENIESVSKKEQKDIVFPIHPRTRKTLKHFGLWQKLKSIPGLHIIDPVGYLDFLMLIAKADIVFTDSGGIQEEACILKVPCITLRENTERPETVAVGANIIVGGNIEKVFKAIDYFHSNDRDWQNPLGDGLAAEKIVDVLECKVVPGIL
jgi:UDP-N-acetylglucosamine 2-epimerase (non-hydrolysing)